MRFKINNYLSLQLDEDGKTIILVKGRVFGQCKYVLINIPIKEVSNLEEIESIDEAVEILDKSLEILNEGKGNKFSIPSEVEFWGHCSNLQVWYENGYNTQLLHMNLAFSLLHELSKAGEWVARKAFKEEIAKRLSSGHQSVVNYLFNQGYTSFLSSEELFYSILEPEEAETLLEIERITQHEYHRVENLLVAQNEGELRHFTIQDRKIVGLDLNLFNEDERFPKSIVKLKNLKILYLYILDSIEKFPEEITYMKSLEQLTIYFGELSRVKEIPESIGNLSGLKKLILFEGDLDTLPSSLGNLEKLEALVIHMPSLSMLPKSIDKLKSLKWLEILDCSFTTLPFSISNLGSLEKLVIENKLLNKTIIEDIALLNFSKSNDHGSFSIYQK